MLWKRTMRKDTQIFFPIHASSRLLTQLYMLSKLPVNNNSKKISYCVFKYTNYKPCFDDIVWMAWAEKLSRWEVRLKWEPIVVYGFVWTDKVIVYTDVYEFHGTSSEKQKKKRKKNCLCDISIIVFLRSLLVFNTSYEIIVCSLKFQNLKFVWKFVEHWF